MSRMSKCLTVGHFFLAYGDYSIIRNLIEKENLKNSIWMSGCKVYCKNYFKNSTI